MTETGGENDVEFEQMDRSYSVVCEGAKLYIWPAGQDAAGVCTESGFTLPGMCHDDQ